MPSGVKRGGPDTYSLDVTSDSNFKESITFNIRNDKVQLIMYTVLTTKSYSLKNYISDIYDYMDLYKNYYGGYENKNHSWEIATTEKPRIIGICDIGNYRGNNDIWVFMIYIIATDY